MTQLTVSSSVLPPPQSNKVPVVQHPHHVHPLTPLITYSNEHFTPGNPPPHLPADVDPKTGKLGNSNKGLCQWDGGRNRGGGESQSLAWERKRMLLGGGGVSRAQFVCWGPVSPSSLKRSTSGIRFITRFLKRVAWEIHFWAHTP